MTNSQRKAYYVRYNRAHSKAENSMKRLLFGYIASAGTEAVSSFEAIGADAAQKVDDFLSEAKLRETFLEMHLTHAETFRVFLLDNFNKPVEKGMATTLAISFFSQRFQNLVAEFAAQRAAEYVTKIVDGLRQSLRQTIEAAVADNLSKRDVARQIRQTWKEVSRSRSLLIARTETTALSGFAQMETAKEFTIQLDKVWISARDGRTRTDHRSADGQRVKYEDNFTVGGVAMAHPGDPKGGAANCCNCRCTIAFLPRQ